MNCLKILRWFLSILVTFLLIFIIVLGVPFAGFASSVSKKEIVKRWIEEGEVYDKLNLLLIENMKKYSNTGGEGSEQAEFEDESIESLVEDVFPSEWMADQGDIVIDSVYAWIEGSSEDISFTIELSSKTDEMITAISELMAENYESMPNCTEEELLIYDPMTSNCFPPDVTMEEVQSQIEESLRKDLKLEDITFNLSDEVADTDSIERTKSMLHWLQFGLRNLHNVILGGIVMISLVLFLLLPKLKNKFLVTGIVWILSGAILLFSGFYVRANYDSFFKNNIYRLAPLQDQNEMTEQVVELIYDPLYLVVSDVISFMRTYGLILTVLGFVFTIGGFILYFRKDEYIMTDEPGEGGSTGQMPKSEPGSPPVTLTS